MADELAAFDEERELARRQRHDATAVAPERGEATSLEALLKDAQAGAVPDEHLAARTTAVDEEEQIAGQRIASRPVV
jgi:hypothetical protein